MWQNNQGYYGGYPYYQRNCLNPYCQCGANCKFDHNPQCHEGWGDKPIYNQRKDSLNNSMRLVWLQHVYWTRMIINSIAFNSPDIDAVTARLLQNATDNGNLLRPYYGDKIADMYSKLIREHLVIAAELVKAAKAGDQRAVAAIDRRWHENGEEIAEFLSKINPFISKDKLQAMFFEHLALTKQEAVLILQNNIQSSIDVFNKIEAEALQMADTLTNAIVKQFPQFFSG
ncbi:acetylglutamate kinase [Sporosarcina sp. P7]|uniref:acetylglutamate kinase n=1 Tax=Sporosarcina sp. P7 TaxID=2048244 RepID=UPI000C1638E5|nr:acetylglutamate kinase [Sporosarcina sp. P7]PID25456.1 acetylglutamate kinase [Sporosarcina sp. P7]